MGEDGKGDEEKEKKRERGAASELRERLPPGAEGGWTPLF